MSRRPTPGPDPASKGERAVRAFRNAWRRRTRTLSVAAGALAGLVVLAPPPGAGASDHDTRNTSKPRPSRTCAAPPARTAPWRSVLISVRCGALSDADARVVREPRHGELERVSQRRELVRYVPDRHFEGIDRFRIARSTTTTRVATTYRVIVGRPSSGPTCVDRDAETNYAEPIKLTVTCRGRGLEELELRGSPVHGDAAVLSESGTATRRTIRLRHTPDEGFVGSDTLLVEATDQRGSSFGAVAIEVAPWKMRALGDSVTAGFGYFDDGSEMPVDDLPDCKPTDSTLNDRCSSNSDQGPGYDSATPSWAADYGLANNVSWPAQFANGLQGGGKVSAPVGFRNLAVTGSAPGDWLAGGSLNPYLDQIVADDPDLIVLTMGANPLLDELLLTREGEECSFTESVATLEQCVLPFFTDANLEGNLESLYTELLSADSADVVVMQYHLAIPSVNLFDNWQLEAMIGLFNEQISSAVADAQAQAGPDGSRLHLVTSQVDPNDPQPDQIARFNIGLEPEDQDTWTAGYDCGWDDEVDGPSHQSDPTQSFFETEHPYEYCEGDEWIIGADSGIHPSQDGYAQFASALDAYVTENDLVPPLP